MDAINWPLELDYEFLRPLVSGWSSKLEAAERARKPWLESVQEIMTFYGKSSAAMWDETYAKKIWKGPMRAPKFRIAVNLPFEYLSVFLPNLMWSVPHRQVQPKRPLQFPPELIGSLYGITDPQQLEQFSQQVQQQSSQQHAIDKAVAYMLQDWLNYSAAEMPGGGLEQHSKYAVTDALLKGRGTLWVRPYKFPASNRTLTGCFYEPPERMLIDPDFRCLEDAKWIALKHIDPHWVVERRFRLPKNSLKDKASLESSWNYDESMGDADSYMHRVHGATNDLVVWYEIYSKTGVGATNSSMHGGIREQLHEAIGDFAYLAIAPCVPYPLNLTTEGLRQGMQTEAVKAACQWPVPLMWADNRWPVHCLDFYPNPDRSDTSAAWPIPPLNPAMGEIKLLNLLIPWIIQRTWKSSRDFWAILGSHIDEYRKYIESGEDQSIIPVSMSHGGKISEAIQILQQPEMRKDMWAVIDLVTDMFRRRTGLVDFAYGKNEGGTQDRTAEATIARQRAVGARPEQMQNQIVAWQSDMAETEAFVARWFVTGEDVQDRFGPFGRQLWETYVMSTDVERTVRQMSYSVAASSIRRPNRERDLSNFMQFMQHWISFLQQYTGATNNYEPANALLLQYGDLHDMDVDDLRLPPPEPNPEAEAMQREQMELEKAKIEAELQGKQIDMQGKLLDAQLKSSQAELQIAGQQAGLEQDQQRHVQEMEQDRDAHTLEMLQDRTKFIQEMQQTTAMGQLKIQQAKQQAKAKPSPTRKNP